MNKIVKNFVMRVIVFLLKIKPLQGHFIIKGSIWWCGNTKQQDFSLACRENSYFILVQEVNLQKVDANEEF